MNGERAERHTGRVGDLFILDAAAAVYGKQRAGHALDGATLQAGDVLMRTAHSGDCFSQYAVFREGKRLERSWCGYDGVGEPRGNVVDTLQVLP